MEIVVRHNSMMSPMPSRLALRQEEDPGRIWDDLPKQYRMKKRGAYIRRHSDLKVTSNSSKFILLMWKNFLVMKRRWKTSTVQFASPIFFVVILTIITTNAQTYHNGETESTTESFVVGHKPTNELIECNTIYLSPKIPAVEAFREHFRRGFVDSANFQYEFTNDKLTNETTFFDLCPKVVFDEEMWVDFPEDRLPAVIHYSVQFPKARNEDDTFPIIQDTVDTQENRSPSANLGYIPGVVFEQLNNKITKRLRWGYPFPGHGSPTEFFVLRFHLPNVLVLGLGISCIILAHSTVKEKELGIRILLKMYGVSMYFHKYTGILYNLIFLSLSGLCIAMILLTNWSSNITGTSVITEEVVAEIFFVLLICYIFNVICTVTLFVTFFSRALVASICLAIFWIVSYAPFFYITNIYTDLTLWGKALICISCNMALGIGCLIVGDLQADENLEGWNAVFSASTGKSFQELRVGWVMLIMIISGILQLFLARYISNVHPGSGILRLPWNYFLKQWYWNNQLPPEEGIQSEKTHQKSFEEIHAEYFEDDTNIQRRKELWLENISKFNGEHRTLYKINMLCYQGHVTVLLGDQGSGKSSLLKIISGLVAPSAGTIYLSRKDLYKNPIFGRAFVGYCPPENLLFPDLTVGETLQFFAELKGMSNAIECYEEVERLLKITTLVDLRDILVCQLPKSSQRMLMVATAFCGGSRVILLDDPTLHLSPAQQRVLWDFTANEKKHRTILVAMDLVHEVDSVVDQIVILHYGQLTARGSPEFLQNRFDSGYYLELRTTPGHDIAAVTEVITRRVPGGHVFSSDGTTLDFYLPESYGTRFPDLLQELETYRDSYGVTSIEVKYVSLEESDLSFRFNRQSVTADDLMQMQSAAEQDGHNEIHEPEKVTRKHTLFDIPLPPTEQQRTVNTSGREYFMV